MSTGSRLTTTSYAILGLLSVRPWTTYELARQMDRSLGRLWPRAQSKLYEEPKKLAEAGYARATEQWAGKRRRTEYAITARGRRALALWLATPGAGPVLECEQLLQLFFAENGTRDDALATIAATRQWALERNEGNLAAARAYAEGTGPFQERIGVHQLTGRFLTDFYAMVRDWADWAESVAASWPDDPGDAEIDQAAMEESLRRAQRTARPVTRPRRSRRSRR